MAHVVQSDLLLFVLLREPLIVHKATSQIHAVGSYSVIGGSVALDVSSKSLCSCFGTVEVLTRLHGRLLDV